MRWTFLGDVKPRGMAFGLGGGVVKSVSFACSQWFFSDGELIDVSICTETEKGY
jgi:hypothetical protein